MIRPDTKRFASLPVWLPTFKNLLHLQDNTRPNHNEIPNSSLTLRTAVCSSAILLSTKDSKEGSWCKVVDHDAQSPVDSSRKSEPHSIKFALSQVVAYGVMFSGLLFNVASILLPWGITISSIHFYLPWSIVIWGGDPLPVADFLMVMQAYTQLLTISVLSKAAVILGLPGIVLYWYGKRRALSRILRASSYIVILASGITSFVAVAILALTEVGLAPTHFGLSWGAYLALAGGASMVLGVVFDFLEVEVVVEREVSEPED